MVTSFNPRTYIRYDNVDFTHESMGICFNPRTYIRYDLVVLIMFSLSQFQSTYLYKVRPHDNTFLVAKYGFNPRTYIRYDSF